MGLGGRNGCKSEVNRLYKDSGVDFILRTNVGVDTYVHKEKLWDILNSGMSCDAEPWMKCLESKIDRLGVSVDVGANIGIVTSWLSRKSDIVYSFEPEPTNLVLLKKNIGLNLCANVNVVPKAVGERNGAVEFYTRSSFGHHGIKRRHVSDVVSVEKVEMLRLGDYLNEVGVEYVGLLKIDVEGAEKDVLLGVAEYLEEKKIGLIVFEHSPILLGDKDDLLGVYDLLKGYGYNVFDISHKSIGRNKMRTMRQGDFYAKCD